MSQSEGFLHKFPLAIRESVIFTLCLLCLFKLRPRLCIYEFISFNKIWYPWQESNLLGKCRYNAPLLCTESQPLLSSAVLEVGVWAVSVARTCSMCALLPHLQRWFMARTQATLSELFISTEDKRKSWLYYPGRVGLFTQQTGLSCTGPASHRSDLPFSEAINRPMCAEHQQAVLNAKCYLLEHKFH